MNRTINKASKLNGTITVPGDKSISHRSIMLGALSKGTTHISGFLTGEDCLSTVSCFRKMGIEIEIDDTNVTVYGKGLYGLSKPNETLYVGNSGTTLRLMTGILSAQNFSCDITGDESIQKRPMDRVSIPLSLMGADITGTEKNGKLCAPLHINGKELKAIEYKLPVASAQVKSAILLASMYAKGETTVIEPEPTRDHTEIMLNYLGANIKHDGNRITCTPVKELYAHNITVPADISSAAYFITAGLICPDSVITIKNVGVNPTRTGITDVYTKMGADITFSNEMSVCGEATADITVRYSKLKGTVIGGDIIPRLIDEIPIIAVAACFAQGTTIIKDAQELKVKESNRIKTVVEELTKLGADIKETDDGMIINGTGSLKGAVTESHNDHRIAMACAVAGLVADGKTQINNSQCVDISFPGYFELLESLM